MRASRLHNLSRAGRLFAWLAALGLMGLFLKSDIKDPDLWWHLASGRFMLETKAFIRTDVFSHTLSGHPWIDFEWLSQIIMVLIYKGWGLMGLFYGKILLGLMTILFLAKSMRLQGARGAGLLFLSGWGFLILQSRIGERPELFSFILLPILISVVLWAEMKIRHRNICLAIIFIIMALWVNLHGGCLLGLGVLILLATGAFWARRDGSYKKFLLLACLLSMAALFINPYGGSYFTVYIDHMKYFGYLPHGTIEEWGVSTLPPSRYFWALYLFTLGALILVVKKKLQSALFWVPAVFATALWGTVYFRNSALFAFVALPFLAHVFFQTTFPQKFSELFHKWIQTGLWLGCFLIFIFEASQLNRRYTYQLIRPYRFPDQACQFIKNNDIQGRMYNTYHYGGYINWVLGPDWKVFWDGRYIMLPLLLDHVQLNTQLDTWPIYLDKYGVDFSLIKPEANRISMVTSLAGPSNNIDIMFPRKQWALVFWDDAALIYLKRIPKFESLIKKYEYRYVWPYDLETMREKLRLKIVNRDDFKRELNRQKSSLGFSVIGHTLEIMEASLK